MLVSIQGLAQALSQENDNVFMSLEDCGLLANDLLESIIKNQQRINKLKNLQ